MEALASPLSFLIKPVQGPEVEAPLGVGGVQAGLLPQDVFADLLAQQLKQAGLGELSPDATGIIDFSFTAGNDADQPAVLAQLLQTLGMALTPASLKEMSGMPGEVLTPASSTEVSGMPGLAQTPAALTEVPGMPKQIVLGMGGDAMPAGTGKEKMPDVADYSPLDIMSMQDDQGAVNALAERQAVASGPASFAASPGAFSRTDAEIMPLRGGEVRFDQTSVPPGMNNLPAPTSTATPFVIPVAATEAAPGTGAQPVRSAIFQPVTSDAWGSMLGDRAVWMVGNQHQSVELHLNPPSLGPLEIKLSMSDNQANLTFLTQHAPVKEAIDAATLRLREMLAESGVSLGSVSVNVGTFTHQQAGGEARSDGQARGWDGSVPAEQELMSATVTLLRRDGMVDIFA